MALKAYSSVLTQLSLLCISVLAFSIRLFSVVKYESVIHGELLALLQTLAKPRGHPLMMQAANHAVQVGANTRLVATSSPQPATSTQISRAARLAALVAHRLPLALQQRPTEHAKKPVWVCAAAI